MTNLSMVLQLSGKNGMFTVENSVNLFHDHETTTSIKEKNKAIVKELRKMAKNGEVTVDILSLDDENTWTRKDVLRFFVNESNWKGAFTVDVRKFNGYDFSDSTVFNFADTTNLYKYVSKLISEYTATIMGSLPEEKSRYSQSLDKKYENT